MDIQKSIVVKRIPSFKPLLWVVLVSSIIFSLMFGYSFSQYSVKDLIHENNRLRDLVSKLEISLADSQRQIQILEIDSKVESGALENTRQEIMLLQGQLNANEEQLLLYRQLLQDGDQFKGLSVVKFELHELSERQFSYRWILRQKTEKMALANVFSEIFILGKYKNQSSTIALSDLDSELSEFPIPLKLKFFLINQGVLELPDGFDPLQIQITSRYSWNKKTAYNDTFDWIVGG